MSKAYRNIIIISSVIALVSVIISGDQWITDNIWYTCFRYLSGCIAYTIMSSLSIGVTWYILKKGAPYPWIFLCTFSFTIYFFYMETTVWDKMSNYPIGQSIFEWLVVMPFCATFIFGILSSVYRLLKDPVRLLLI